MLNPTSLLRRATMQVGRALIFDFSSLGRGDTGTYEPVPDTGSAQTRASGNSSTWKIKFVALVLVQVALGLIRDSSLEPNKTENASLSLRSISARLAVLDALKFASCALLLHLRTRHTQHSWSPGSSASAELETQPLQADEASQAEGNPSDSLSTGRPVQLFVFGSKQSNLTIGTLALLLIANSYLTVLVMNSDVANAFAMHLSTLVIPFFSASFLCAFGSSSGSSQKWLGIALQILGLLSLENDVSRPKISNSSIILLITLGLLNSLICIAIYNTFNRHDSIIPSKFNTRLFACTFLAHLFLCIFSRLFASPSFIYYTSHGSYISLIALLLRASVDVVGFDLIYDCGPVLFSISASLSGTILLAWSRLANGTASISELSGLVVALLGVYACCSSVSQQQEPESNKPLVRKTFPSRVLLPAILFFLIATFAYVVPSLSAVQTEEQIGDSGHLDVLWVQPGDSVVFADLPYIPPSPPPPPSPSTCERFPLPSEEFFSNRTYHEFDDVLLIVFFSHARYDVNLDYYKEVYSEFFPNMVFVGPKSREDKGFEHSYDVLVDSYESDEDISDWNNYKMAGRMAHHMLYTVLTTPTYANNCYKGFLWAPFDTLLNVPRLQLFDQDKIWYFSPWGEYVANQAIDEERWMNASNHPPPARISPDPEMDFEKEFRGWWVDWWWGDPHYGIPVCKSAFKRVPSKLRHRMAKRFTNKEPRYIGGSADTLYIPARLANEFIDLLGTFLNTSCFLEIAVPTIVHLLVPEDDKILFVDHWWIWTPPFNASFVRDRWEHDMEVDTFHTFHWGDKDADGVWRANRDNIEDVRLLLKQSAARQGVIWSR